MACTRGSQERPPLRKFFGTESANLRPLSLWSNPLGLEQVTDCLYWSVNTDQGSQFSTAEFVPEVTRIVARQSMNGKGCRRDNVFVEWLWRSVKYEDLYVKVADPPLHPASVERQVPRHSGQPPTELANVRYRRPPTFTGQIRATAPRFKRVLESCL